MKKRLAMSVGVASVGVMLGATFLMSDKQSSDLGSQLEETPNSNAYLAEKRSNIQTPLNESTEIHEIYPNEQGDTYSSAYGPLANSLRGTSIPGYFALTDDGNLVVTPSLKSMIDYFLAALGEEPIETIIGRIEEYFTKHLSEPARSQAIGVLAEYISYKEALIDLEGFVADNNLVASSGHDYLTLFEYRRDARMNSLSAEVYEAFFAEEDALDAYTAAVLQRKRDAREDGVQSGSLVDLEGLLPEQEQNLKQLDRDRQKIQAAKEAGATAQELHELRRTVYDEETVQRFAEADQKQSAWDARFAEYRQKRELVLNTNGLSDSDKQLEIQALQASMFDVNERKRLATLDKMADREI